MNRTYDREWYKQKIDRIYEIMPDCAISSDIITGFCSETEEEHQDTMSIIEYSNYSMSYMFFYSERPGTLAARKFEDDIPFWREDLHALGIPNMFHSGFVSATQAQQNFRINVLVKFPTSNRRI